MAIRQYRCDVPRSAFDRNCDRLILRRNNTAGDNEPLLVHAPGCEKAEADCPKQPDGVLARYGILGESKDGNEQSRYEQRKGCESPRVREDRLNVWHEA